MRILAIDPGSLLGWATDATGRLEWGTEDFRIKGGESSGNRWRRFGMWLDLATFRYVNRYPSPDVPVFDEFDARPTREIIGTSIDLIVYEKAHFPSAARYAADVAAGFTTRLEEHCERRGIALQPVAVQTLKAFALPKPPTRKKGDPLMDRSKAAMIAAAWNRLYSEWLKNKQIMGKSILRHNDPRPNEHEADALWLYWWAKENCK